MFALAILLFVVGIADATRSWHLFSLSAWASPLLTAGIALLLAAWALGLSWHQWWIVPPVAIAVLAWLIVPLHPGRQAPGAALAVLTAAVLAALAAGQLLETQDGPLQRWFGWLDLRALDGVSFEQFVFALACLIFLLSSANVIVRLVLAGAGPRVLEAENTLKGGRVLGPLERWFIFSMALAGQFGAIAAVVAAKGIVRFPEISRSDSTGNKAEYVLVGSFVSWLLALVFVPLFS